MLIGLKEKEATGKFTPKAHMNALHETLGKDHSGCVRGVGGVRLSLIKLYGDQYTTTKK